MIIGQSLLNTLTAQAKASPRLRQHFDLRNTSWDGFQRMQNTFVIPPINLMEMEIGDLVLE